MRAIVLVATLAFSVAVAAGVFVGGWSGAADVAVSDLGSNCMPGPVSTIRAQGATPPRRLLGMWWEDSATPKGTLAELDPQTLVPGRRVTAGPFGASWAFSPDGRRLALGGPEGAVRFIDLRRMRKLGDLRPEISGYVVALAWPSPNRLLALEQWVGDATAQRTWLLVVDPLRRRLLDRRPLPGGVDEVEEADGRIVAVVPPPERIGRARLAVVEPTGRIRCVVLREISTGSEYVRIEEALHVRKPGLALDPAADRAFVFSPGEPIAEVDLRDLRVSYHEQGASLLSRLLDWLEPDALAKLPQMGSRRQALWLGDGLLAVSGADQELGDNGRYSESPAGLQLVDTTTWSVRTLDQRVSRIRLADDVLLAFGGYGTERFGVSVYTRSGELRFRRFVGEEVWDVQAVGSYAYVSIGEEISVVDLRSGAVTREVSRTLGELLAGEERPWF
jgi:hypothetical protein